MSLSVVLTPATLGKVNTVHILQMRRAAQGYGAIWLKGSQCTWLQGSLGSHAAVTRRGAARLGACALSLFCHGAHGRDHGTGLCPIPNLIDIPWATGCGLAAAQQAWGPFISRWKELTRGPSP